jgi:hypothetical protein
MNNTIPTYFEPIQLAFANMWASVIGALPQIIMAILVLTLGLLLSSVLREMVLRVAGALKIDNLVSKLEVNEIFDRAEIELSISKLLAWFVKWFIIILTLVATADILNWHQVTNFLAQVMNYVPNVLIAVIILFVGILLGNFTRDVVSGTFEAAKVKTGHFLAALAKWAIIVFSFMAALVQLGIAQALIQVLFTGFVAMIALAGGLAFGLGGKEHASEILSAIKQDLTKK